MPVQALPESNAVRRAEHRQQRLGEEEDDEQVGQRRQTEGEREAADVTDRHDVEDDRGEQRHRVGRQDRAPRSRPGAVDGAAQPSALADLVSQSLEEDDERVGRDADGDDEAGDAGQRQRVADRGVTEQRRHGVQDQPGDREAADRHQTRAPGSRAARTAMTSARPIAPAIRPPRSCCDTQRRGHRSVTSDCVNFSGSEPYFRTLARSVAWSG